MDAPEETTPINPVEPVDAQEPETAVKSENPETEPVKKKTSSKASRKEAKLGRKLEKSTVALEKAVLKEGIIRDVFVKAKEAVQKAKNELNLALAAQGAKKQLKDLKSALKSAKKALLKQERTLDKVEKKRKIRQKELKQIRKKLIE